MVRMSGFGDERDKGKGRPNAFISFFFKVENTGNVSSLGPGRAKRLNRIQGSVEKSKQGRDYT